MATSDKKLGELATFCESEYLRAFTINPVPGEWGNGVYVGVSGCDSNDKNGVIAEADATTDDVIQAVDWMRQQSLPATLFCTPDLACPELLSSLAERDILPDQNSSGMGASMADLSANTNQVDSCLNISIELVSTQKNLEDWLNVAEQCGWLSDEDMEGDRRLRNRHMQSMIRNNQAVFLTASLRNELAGMAGMAWFNGTGVVTDMATIARYQRQGVATAMTRFCLNWLRHTRVEGVPTQHVVLAPTSESRPLYSNFGLREFPFPRDSIFYL